MLSHILTDGAPWYGDLATGPVGGILGGTRPPAKALLWMALAETICAEDIEAICCSALSRAA